MEVTHGKMRESSVQSAINKYYKIPTNLSLELILDTFPRFRQIFFFLVLLSKFRAQCGA